jgi:hypothetical protein
MGGGEVSLRAFQPKKCEKEDYFESGGRADHDRCASYIFVVGCGLR